MGNCFSSQRGTTGKLSDPTHGTGLTSLHSMQGGDAEAYESLYQSQTALRFMVVLK